MEHAKIALMHGRISFSAEGSEAFVNNALKLWDKLLATPAAPDLPSDEPPSSKLAEQRPSVAATGIQSYENVFDVADDKVKIIADIGGKTKAEQTRRVALLMLFAHHLNGNEPIQSELIRAACVDQGCYDSTNFAGYLKSLKSSVVMNTKAGGQYDIKLTAPGRKAAKELVDQLQGV